MANFITFLKNFDYPDPLGLSLGILFVAIGQVVVLTYYYLWHQMGFVSVQNKRPNVSFWRDVKKHFSGVEAFVMLLSYLIITWMFRLMPPSYYELEANVNWWHVLLQFASVDFFTYINHWLEHNTTRWVYGLSHKPHHQYHVPKMLDAFSGSVADTTILILVPLFITMRICNFVNCWSYIAFGTLYSTYFMLIHSEFRHMWDDLFELLGVGTAEDHNVHHAILTKNYGHFFMWWDIVFGTFMSPLDARDIRRKRIIVNKSD